MSEPNFDPMKDTPIRLDGSRWWHTPYVLPVVDGTPGLARKICAPYDGVHLFRLWQVEEQGRRADA